MKKKKEKELRMAWKVEKGGKRSFVVGTAHFFPFSFKTPLTRMLQGVRVALFEGPLDRESLEKVLRAGRMRDGDSPILKDLDERVLTEMKRALFPSCKRRRSLFVFRRKSLEIQDPLVEMIRGMKPWLAFFTLWSQFLKLKGWENSVDLEAYHLALEMGKEVGSLESIEEQIEVLERISYEKIVDFLKRVEHWEEYAEKYLDSYLRGDLESLKRNAWGFPSRHHRVIDHRDEIFYQRMRRYLEQGDVLVCVGAPHVPGVRELAEADGFRIQVAWG